MQRTVAYCLLAICLAGCGAGGKAPLFSGSNGTRVPPPGTKSYGTPDNSYYNGNLSVPATGLSGGPQSNPTFGAANASFAANDPRSGSDLNWRPIGSRLGAPVVPPALQPTFGSAPFNNPGSIAPAGFSAPAKTNSPMPWRNQEAPVRIVENTNPAAMEPGRFIPAPNAAELSALPPTNPAPRVRMSSPTGANNMNAVGSAAPIPQTPAAIPNANSGLNWRTRN